MSATQAQPAPLWMPGIYRAMVVLQGVSGLPEDRYITTWHFEDVNTDILQPETYFGVGGELTEDRAQELYFGSTFAEQDSALAQAGAELTGYNAHNDNVANAIVNMLDAFFTADTGQGSLAGNFLPAASISSVEYRIYHLGEALVYAQNAEGEWYVADKRAPMLRTPSWTPGGTGAPLPQEIALVLSERTAKNGPRGRGRAYFGPFVEGVNTNTDGRSVPLNTLVDAILAGATDLLNSTENPTWGVLSVADRTFRPVTGGYVDNAWDVQRSRGRAPTSRTAFGDYAA